MSIKDEYADKDLIELKDGEERPSWPVKDLVMEHFDPHEESHAMLIVAVKEEGLQISLCGGWLVPDLMHARELLNENLSELIGEAKHRVIEKIKEETDGKG